MVAEERVRQMENGAFSLTFAALSPEELRAFERFLAHEETYAARYPHLYKAFARYRDIDEEMKTELVRLLD